MKLTVLSCIILFFTSQVFAVNQYPLDSDYHTWNSLSDSLLYYHQYNRLHSEIEIIGNSSADNLPIYAFHIHQFEDVKSKKKKLWEHSLDKDIKKVLIIGQHHGEEPIGVEITMAMIRELTTQEDVPNLIKEYYFVIIPTVNPEAFKIVNSGQYPLKRKNNKDTNHNGKFELKTDGVDLNKNYPSNWELADLDHPESQYYKGQEPASESEIKAVINLANRFSFDYAFLYHSSANGTYPEVVFFPYNWGNEKSKDWDNMKGIAESLTANLPSFYSEEKYRVNTGETSKYGYARDFLYREYNTYSFTIEVGAVTPNGVPLFLPQNSDLKTIVENNKSALMKLLWKINSN